MFEVSFVGPSLLLTSGCKAKGMFIGRLNISLDLVGPCPLNFPKVSLDVRSIDIAQAMTIIRSIFCSAVHQSRGTLVALLTYVFFRVPWASIDK